MTQPAGSINVRVNDEERKVRSDLALAEVLDEMGFAGRQGVAVAVNAVVVPRQEWSARVLRNGDEVLVIQASQGG